MSKRKIKPTFIHHQIDGEETCIGEFHHGSASDKKILPSGKGIKLFLTDPPYNLGFDYGEVTDSQPEEDYHQMMEEIFDSCYEAADDDAHLFIIHYPQDMAKMWPRLTKKWKFHQWINWNYPANFGHSTKKWTNASRTILWLVKGDPEFYGDRVVQPYRNPTDRRIKKLIHEDGKKGTHLYNWWQVNLCKNVSKDKKNYSNQIPEALLERIILSTTNLGDLVADPFSGTFSTSRTAMRLGRRAWGCDLNQYVVKWRPTIDEYVHEPDIPEQQFDKQYPTYPLLEAGLTESQFQKLAIGLIKDPEVPTSILGKWVGKKTAANLRGNLAVVEVPKQSTLDAFGTFAKDTDIPPSDPQQESHEVQEKPYKGCLTEDEFKLLKEELSIEGVPLDENLLLKRQKNLKFIKNNFDSDDTLSKENWDGNNPNANPITSIRKENHQDITKWRIKETHIYTSTDGRRISALRPGKEAHDNYRADSYYGTNNRSTGSPKKKLRKNEFDFLPVIIDGKINIARRLVYQNHSAYRRGLSKKELVKLCLENEVSPYLPNDELVDVINNKLGQMKKSEVFSFIKLGTPSIKITKKIDQNQNKSQALALAREILVEMSVEDLKKVAKDLNAQNVYLTKKELVAKLSKNEVVNPNPVVQKYTPWTLEHLAVGLENLKFKDCGQIALEILGSILVRMAHMLDHNENEDGFYELEIPKFALSILERLLPKGILIVGNQPKECNDSMQDFSEDYISIDSLLYFLDILSNNEDVKSDWKGHRDLKADGEIQTPIGRVNTLLTYATFIGTFINPKNLISTTLFRYNRTQNHPKKLSDYQNDFRFLSAI